MTSYYPAVEPTKKWSEMSQGQQRSAKEQYGSRSNYMDRKQAATGGGGVMPPRENPGFAPPSFGGGGGYFDKFPTPGKGGSIGDYIPRNPEKDPNIRRPGPSPTPINKGPQPTPYRGQRPSPSPGGEFGGRIGMKPGMVGTADFRDSDGDGTDDRNQRRAGGRDVVKKRQERDQRRSQRNDKARDKAVKLRETYKGAVKKKLKKNKKNNRNR